MEQDVQAENTLPPPTPARLEAFSDGVIAVIVTIMVLDLRVPGNDGVGGLRQLLPDLGIYLLSFAFTGIYWLNHQHLVRRLERAGYWLQISNLFFLFCLSVLPFSTKYLIAHRLSPYSVQQYAATLAFVATAFYLVRISVHLHLKLDDKLKRADVKAKARHLWSIAGYIIAIPLAAWKPTVALAVIVLETAGWAVPDLSTNILRTPARKQGSTSSQSPD